MTARDPKRRRPPERRYATADEDSARWLDFEFRSGDIVISTRSKHGTTWMQMICALLVLGTPELPRPLPQLSPWLDWLVLDQDEVFADLAAQAHRRFIKTHTPLDGLPIDADVTYIVVARHPLDAAVSLYHHSHNLDRTRIRELTSPGSSAPAPTEQRREEPSPGEWLRTWVDQDGSFDDNLDRLAGVFWHLSDAWRRRSDDNVELIHYEDLLADLPGEMTRLAAQLGIAISEENVRRLAGSASLEAMRARSRELAPAPEGVIVDTDKFFRRGGTGSGRELADEDLLVLYHERARSLAPPDLLVWLHR